MITPQQNAQTETIQAARKFLYTELHGTGLSRQRQHLIEPYATIHGIVSLSNVYHHVHAMWRRSKLVVHNGRVTSKIVFFRKDESELLGPSGRS